MFKLEKIGTGWVLRKRKMLLHTNFDQVLFYSFIWSRHTWHSATKGVPQPSRQAWGMLAVLQTESRFIKNVSVVLMVRSFSTTGNRCLDALRSWHFPHTDSTDWPESQRTSGSVHFWIINKYEDKFWSGSFWENRIHVTQSKKWI